MPGISTLTQTRNEICPEFGTGSPICRSIIRKPQNFCFRQIIYGLFHEWENTVDSIFRTRRALRIVTT